MAIPPTEAAAAAPSFKTQAAPARAAARERAEPRPQAAPTAVQAQQARRAELEQVLQQLRESLPTSAQVEFSIDEETHRTVVKVVDADTQEVLRQIPSDEMLSVARRLGRLMGLLVSDKA